MNIELVAEEFRPKFLELMAGRQTAQEMARAIRPGVLCRVSFKGTALIFDGSPLRGHNAIILAHGATWDEALSNLTPAKPAQGELFK